MSNYNIAIFELAQTALAELAQARSSGKVPNNPRSQAHFFSAWVTRAIKTQRFPHCVAKTLQSWQKAARTQGVNAAIDVQLENIVATYQPLIHNGAMAPISQQQLLDLFDQLDNNDWYVERDYPIDRKVSHHTDGQASLVVCSKQWAQVFNPELQLVRPISLYARGNIQQLVNMAYQQQLLLHKVSDYKSLVKFHGELVVYPANAGNTIAAFPAD